MGKWGSVWCDSIWASGVRCGVTRYGQVGFGVVSGATRYGESGVRSLVLYM